MWFEGSVKALLHLYASLAWIFMYLGRSMMVCGGGSGIWNARLALDDVGHQTADVGPVR